MMIIIGFLLVLVQSQKIFDFRLPLVLELLSTEPNFNLSQNKCAEDYVETMIVPEDGSLILVQNSGSCVDDFVISELSKVKLYHNR